MMESPLTWNDQQRWQGFFDGLTDPFKDWSASEWMEYSDEYKNGWSAGKVAYVDEHDKWLREITDEPF